MANNGAFALILECLPDRLGRIITQSLDIPTIGIGSGADCDGQALVTQDMLGLYKEMSPRFLKIYADLAKITVGRAERLPAGGRNRCLPCAGAHVSDRRWRTGKLLAQFARGLRELTAGRR